eukprot:gene19296-biopygen23478
MAECFLKPPFVPRRTLHACPGQRQEPGRGRTINKGGSCFELAKIWSFHPPPGQPLSRQNPREKRLGMHPARVRDASVSSIPIVWDASGTRPQPFLPETQLFWGSQRRRKPALADLRRSKLVG